MTRRNFLFLFIAVPASALGIAVLSNRSKQEPEVDLDWLLDEIYRVRTKQEWTPSLQPWQQRLFSIDERPQIFYGRWSGKRAFYEAIDQLRTYRP